MRINNNISNDSTNQFSTNFTTGRVLDVIHDIDHKRAKELGGYDSIGAIYYEDLGDGEIGGVAKPLFSFIKNLPLIGEIVLIITQPNKNFEEGTNGNYIEYYLPNINIWNHPHINAIPNISLEKSNTETDYQETEGGLSNKPQEGDEELFFGNYFNEKSDIKPLLPFEGDIILEGRFGNSIRFGSTNVNNDYLLNPWSKEKNEDDNGDPITIIRNGQSKDVDDKGWVPVIEDINNDDTTIILTSNQQININPSSLNQKSYGANLQKVDLLQVGLTNPTTEEVLEPEFEESYEPILEEEAVTKSPPTPNIEGCTDPMAQNYNEEATLDDGSCIFLEENTLVESSTDTLELGPKSSPQIGNSGPNDAINELPENLGQIVGSNFSLAHLISSGIFKTQIHSEALYEKYRAYSDLLRGDVEENYMVKDTLGFYETRKGPFRTIVVKDSKYNIIYETEKSTADATTMINIAETAISGHYTVEELSPPESHELYTPPYNPEAESLEQLNNYPGVDEGINGEDIVTSLSYVMTYCIDPIIQNSPFGQNLVIKSAYRSQRINEQIGGTTMDNEHLRGQAIDFTVIDTNIELVWEWCYNNLDNYHQLMLAYPEKGEDGWIHISYKNPSDNKKFTTLASNDLVLMEVYILIQVK